MTRPLPLHLGEPMTSMLAVMLFPDNHEKAAAFAAKQMASGSLLEMVQNGTEISSKYLGAMVSALIGGELTTREIDVRNTWGSTVGEIVRVNWALHCTDPKRAGWAAAMKSYRILGGRRASDKQLAVQLRRFAPVLHLWGAVRLRSDSEIPLASDDHPIGTHAWALMMEAMKLLEALRLADAARGEHSRSSYLDSDQFGPWEDFDNYRPITPFPGNAELTTLKMTDDVMRHLSGPGRRRKTPQKESAVLS